MLHLSFSTLISTMELQNYNGPTSIVCEPLPSVRPSNTLWQSVFGTLFANFVNCNGTLKIYWNILVRHDMHCLSWWTNKYLSLYHTEKGWIKIYVNLKSTALSMQLPNQKGKTKLLFQRCKWEDKEVILDWDDIFEGILITLVIFISYSFIND